jgi:RNA polymerase sigma factor (sigma-70 family)
VNALSDLQLLRAYAERRSEAAFAELVRRHIDLVHSAALRMLNDSHLAKDVTQGVFVALAKDAGKLADHPVLSGWLHRTARNIASNTIRTEVRRRTREQEAAAMHEPFETDASWEEIAPHLDAALADLNEPDRDVVLLRYFENKPAQEMAAILGISAEAAQKRVSRAVDKLRGNFAKRGITAGTAGLSSIISANAVQAAPAGLAAAVSTAAFSGVASSVLAITKFLTMTVMKNAIAATAIAALAGTAIYQFTRQPEAAKHESRVAEQASPSREHPSRADHSVVEQLANARPDADREVAACLAVLTELLESSERARIVDRAKGVREIQMTPELRKRYLAPDDKSTMTVGFVSLVVNRPTDAECDNAARIIDENLSALHFLDVFAREELKQQLTQKYFNYKKASKIIRKQTYTDKLGVEHHSIISYDTDQVMEWDGENGVLLSPEDASDIEVMKGGREAYLDRYAHVFK